MAGPWVCHRGIYIEIYFRCGDQFTQTARLALCENILLLARYQLTFDNSSRLTTVLVSRLAVT